MAFLKIIVGYARAQVVDVMEAYVSGEPLEKLWEFVE